jgi:Uncharacterized homolog of phage Mu protein gp47
MLESVAYESALIWDLLEDLYYSGYVDFATGDSLDHLVALLGIRRKAATRAEGTVLFSRSAAGSIVTIPPAPGWPPRTWPSSTRPRRLPT